MSYDDQSKSGKTHNIFISHRHVDKAVADVFSKLLPEWSDQKVSVYQSSSTMNSTRFTDALDASIANAVSEAKLVLLIFTEAPGSMDWCMYECGLSQDLSNSQSKILAFHTTEKPPSPLSGLVTMPLDQDAVHKFTVNFHKDPEFFQGSTLAIAPEISADVIAVRARKLYSTLKEIAPEPTVETAAYDRITLGLDSTSVQQILTRSKSTKIPELYDELEKIFADELHIRAYSGDPFEHFNFSVIDKKQKFHELAERWYVDSEFNTSSRWYEGVRESITRAILRRPERECAFPFNSLDGDEWLLPLLTTYRVIPHESIWEFELLLCRLNPTAALRMLNINNSS